MNSLEPTVSRVLAALSRKDATLGELAPLVYDDLKQIAGAKLAKERDVSLSATALVHEAWIRLAGNRALAFEDRRAFFGAAAVAMQRAIVDAARAAKSDKRGGKSARLDITVSEFPALQEPSLLLELGDELDRLAAEDARAAEVARLRLFAGLEVDRVAELLDVSPRTAAREWAYARARLADALSGAGG
jgi:RNA polymerase sigma factor (TIGR02999 family)